MPFISKQIEELLLVCDFNQDFSYILSDFTLDWDVIKKAFDTRENLDEPSTCLKLKRQLDPIISKSHETVLKNKEDFQKSLELNAEWTFSHDEIKRIFDGFCKNARKYALTGFLQLTAIIEFSLGNVYQTCTHRQPPHLLKDLLKELRTCGSFHEIQIFILQILLGTSKGSNLRNVTWHGFVDTIDPAYISFLFIVINTYGKQLKSALLKPKYSKFIELTLEISLQPEKFDQILASPVIQNCNFKAWEAIIDFYHEQRFTCGIYILLCQIENLLRYIYGELNSLNICAELNKYYVIMDSIFYGYILSNDTTPLVIGKITKIQEMEIRMTHQQNKLLDYFPRSIFYMHYDLFYAAEGPRLRDKISHGEVNIDNENAEKIYLALLQFSLDVVEFYDYQKIHSDYESRYMSNLIFHKEFKIINNLIENLFENLEIPSTLKGDISIKKFEKVILPVEKEQLRIHFRPLVETQIVKMMLKILETLKSSIRNFHDSSNELFQHYQERKLSSSRRNMLANLISFLQNFVRGFHKILALLSDLFLAIQKLDDKFDNEYWTKKTIKKLKQTLQLTQVYQKHFSIDDRNYFVANNKTCEFLMQISDNEQPS